MGAGPISIVPISLVEAGVTALSWLKLIEVAFFFSHGAADTLVMNLTPKGGLAFSL